MSDLQEVVGPMVWAELMKTEDEIARLRNALRLCHAQLKIASLFRGYKGGPLQEPATQMVLRQAEAALKGDSDE